MHGAKFGSLEEISFFLNAGADPNILNSEGMTALAYGIVSGNIEVIYLLAPVTTAGVDQIIIKLAQSSLKIEVDFEKILGNIIDNEKLNFLLENSSLFGNEKLLEFVLNKTNHTWSSDLLDRAFQNLIKTDKEQPVQILRDYYKRINTTGEFNKCIS